MNILVLDDSDMRLEHYKYHYQGHNVVCVKTAAECIAWLAGGPKVDLLHLDHDLAEEHYLTYSEGLHEEPGAWADQEVPPYDPGTGMDVVDWLCDPEHEACRPVRCVVHSWNGVRAPVMAMALNKAGIPTLRQPFQAL